MSNFLMKFGGCAALAACDTCIYLAAKQGWKQIYPYNIAHLCREDYDRFAMKMKPYLRPRIGGVDRLSLYGRRISAVSCRCGSDIEGRQTPTKKQKKRWKHRFRRDGPFRV